MVKCPRLDPGLLIVALLPLVGLAWSALRSDCEALIVVVLLSATTAALLFIRHFMRGKTLVAIHEESYQGIFRCINDGVILYRPSADGQEFIILDINPAGERITQVRREAVLGQMSRQVFPGLEASGLFAVFQRVSESGESETLGLAYRDQRLDLQVENDVIRLPDGEILTVFKDVTEQKRSANALVESLDHLRQAQRIAHLGNWTLDQSTGQLQWSEEVFRILELDPQQQPASESNFYATVHPDDHPRLLAAYAESMALRHPSYELTHRLRFADGRIKYAYVHAETQFAADGRPLITRGTLQDITERHLAQEALQLHAKIFEQSGESIMVTDHDNRIIDINPAFIRQTGYSLERIIGENPRILASGRTPPETYGKMWAALQNKGFWQGELWDCDSNGHIYPKWTSISVIRDESGAITHYIASFIDISERKATEERIEHLAHRDSLTGLYNRYNLEIRLSHALLAARRENSFLAVLFIDLDRFKVINDTLGHAIGDQLLIEVARRLLGCVRESDIVARQGGDEFVVVINALDAPTMASPIATKILHTLAQPYDIGNDRLHTSPSIGIAVFPDDGDDVATLLKHADAAMYHAKNQGRNNLQYFTAELNVTARERLLLERELRVAIEQNQFELHYQPQFAADASDFTRPQAVEALIRWRHPQRGLVPPDRFIPLAEESGLIEKIGDWVLDEAARQFAEWKEAGIGPRCMAVNISAHQLRNASLVERVGEILHRHRLADDELELEITESVAMSNPASAIEQLEALRRLGVTLAIDDFGTGYSSLAYLKRLPIQILKLDRAFVRDIETDENDAAISAATLALAHTLGLKVVAEGVESEGQSRFLRAHGCDLLQGYLYGRPEPAAILAARWQAAAGQGSFCSNAYSNSHYKQH